MQQGDFSSFYNPNNNPHHYPPNPNPNPSFNSTPDFQSRTYASAPPFATSDFTDYSQNYPPFSQVPDPAPPTAPSYTQTQPPVSNPNSFGLGVQQASHFPPYESHVPFQPPPPPTSSAAQQPFNYPPFDQNQSGSGYASMTNQGPTSPYSSAASGYSAPFSRSFEGPYESGSNAVGSGRYFDGGFDLGRSRSDVGSDIYGKQRLESNNSFSGYDLGQDDGYGDGVFAYQGGKMEPYGARGTIPKSSDSTLFDDYGRPISMSGGKDSHSSSGGSGSGSSKIVRAVPKVEVQQDVKGGVQKFRVKLLAESGGQSTMDVLCQVTYL